MKRTIQFRAWDKAKNKMATVWDIGWKAWDLGDELNYVRVECGDGTYDLLELEVELMQFTGLKDRKGKEIYEGDILSVHDPIKLKDVGIITPSGNFLVKYVAAGFWIQKLHCRLDEVSFASNVIGNIYENPELLNG